MSEIFIKSVPLLTWEGPMINQDQGGAIASLHSQGHGKKAIARMLGLHVQTVRRYLAQGVWQPYKRAKERPSIIEPFKEYLLRRMHQVLYSATVLLRELKKRGYTGSYQTVKRFIRPHREEIRRQEAATVRFETAPGQQAQVDWGTTKVFLGSQLVRISVFVMVLGYSRRIFAMATLDEKLPNLLRCHEAAFEHFGGRTQEVLYDNPKTVCLRREEGRAVLNHVFEDFARYWGFTVRLCEYYRARTKGKVESGVKYVKGNFLAGCSFQSLEHLNRELLKWCVEVADLREHGTTHRRPAEAFAEEALVATHGHPSYRIVESLQRIVATDCLVTYRTNRYSVPSRYVGRTVDLVVGGGILNIYHAGEVVGEHALKDGRFGVVSHREHYAELFRKRALAVPAGPAWSGPWPEVEVRSLAIYEEAALTAGGVS